MNSRPLRFVRRGQLVTLPHVPPERTLLDLLREDLGQTGTKEGCGEGDCGACTVVLAELHEGQVRQVRYRAVNSCIRLAHSIDGMALWTVEDLTRDPLLRRQCADAAADLHPVQQAMLECHGSQCGFCTPGFVMSLFGLYQSQIAVSAAERGPASRPSRRSKRSRATCAAVPATAPSCRRPSAWARCRPWPSTRPNCYDYWSY